MFGNIKIGHTSTLHDNNNFQSLFQATLVLFRQEEYKILDHIYIYHFFFCSVIVVKFYYYNFFSPYNFQSHCMIFSSLFDISIYIYLYMYIFFPNKVFGNVRYDSGKSEISRHNNFVNFISALMLLFRYL